jgi:hypothetical protein
MEVCFHPWSKEKPTSEGAARLALDCRDSPVYQRRRNERGLRIVLASIREQES